MNESLKAVQLNAFRVKINDYRSKVDNVILAEFNQRRDSPFYRPLMKALKGGKRLRPIMLVLSSESVGRSKTDPFPAAVAIELAHTESLIHDDIIDRDFLRRGTTTFHASYGNEMALLSADFILSVILDIAAKYADPRVARVLARATSEMCEGELEELSAYRKKQRLSEGEYINIVSKKTASLFEASTTIGAVIAEAKEDEISVLSDYGRLVGIAYQIQDDIADLKKTAAINILQLFDSEKIKTFHKLSASYTLKAKQNLEKLKSSDARGLLVELAYLVTAHSIARI